MLTEYAVCVLRLAVAAVFLLAAYGKLTDRVATRQAMREFGVPLRIAPVVAVALPEAEAAIAIGVVAPASAVIACVAALLLLDVFTAAIGHQLRRGRHPDCSCFGATSEPIGAQTVARNAAIGALAAAALVGSLAYEGLLSGLPADHAIAIAAVVALAAVQVRQGATLRALRRQLEDRGATSAAREGLAVGAAAPEFDLPDLGGRRASLRGLLTAGRPLALVFVHLTCAPCRTLVEDLREWRDSRALTVMPSGRAAWTPTRPGRASRSSPRCSSSTTTRSTPATACEAPPQRCSSTRAAGSPPPSPPAPPPSAS